MNRTPKEIIDWLLQHCERDRVIYNALCNHIHPPDTRQYGECWEVDMESRNGHRYYARVHTNPVGEPVSWHRL